MTDGLKSDAVSFSLGGLEYATFFADDSVIGVFNLNQGQTVSMQTGGQLDSASGRRSTQAGFQRIFQQIRENQAQIDLVYRKTFRQIELHGKWDLLPLRKCAVIPNHAVCRPVFAEVHFKTWNSGNRTGEIGFDLFKIPFFCKGSELMSQDEIAVMDGAKCILQLRGVRPFLSNKYDITKHPKYRQLSDYNKRNAFDIEKYRQHKLVVKPDDTFDLYDMGEVDAD